MTGKGNFGVTALAWLWAASTALADEPMKTTSAVDVAPLHEDVRDQLVPSVAFDGEETFLVVWQQGNDYYETETADILAARINRDGQVLDERPIGVCTAQNSQMNPFVAFSEGVFLVVWMDLRNGRDFDVYAARVSPAGMVLDRDGVLIAGGPHNQCNPAVASGASRFLVTWQNYGQDKSYTTCAARVDAGGRSLDGQGVPLRGKKGDVKGGRMSLAYAGKGWFGFWQLPGAGARGAVGLIEEADGSLAVTELVAPLPQYTGCMGSAASDGRVVMHAGTFITGRGQEHRPATVLLVDAESFALRPNPNPPVGSGGLGDWDEKKWICAHVSNPGIDGPVALAASEGVFMVAAKGSGHAKPPYSDQIHAARLSSDGRLIEKPNAWQVMDAGTKPCGSPALAAGKGGRFLLAYSVYGGPGQCRVVAKVVDAK